MRKVKMYTYKGNWVVVDGERLVPFTKSYDAWQFIFLLRAIRPKAPEVPRSIYSVNTLDPRPAQMRKIVKINLQR